MKKVLVITYYWPPSGGAGVQRWLKTVKYLRVFGWEPIIFTSKGGESPVLDPTLAKDIPNDIEVIEQKIWEPYSFYKKLIGQNKESKIQTGFLKETEKPKILEKLSIWIRGNLFIPDARKYWIKPSVKRLSKFLKYNKIDAIVSTGPPHTTHLIALAINKKLKAPWLADFRDPWTNIDFYDKLLLSKWADKQHRKLESKVLTAANVLVTVSPSWAKDMKELCQREIKVVYNGFDDADMSNATKGLDEKFSIVHIGSMNADRNPVILWEVLADLCKTESEFKDDLEIKLIGSTDISVIKKLQKLGLSDRLKKIDHISHEEVLSKLTSAQLLLLPINNTKNSMGVIPGKLFEYLSSKRPILCVGPTDGDSSKIIQESKAGVVLDFEDLLGMKKAVGQYYQKYKSGTLNAEAIDISKFTRKNLAGEMAEILDSIT